MHVKVAHFLSLNHHVNVTVSYQPHDSTGESKHRCCLSFESEREEIWGHAIFTKTHEVWNCTTCKCVPALKLFPTPVLVFIHSNFSQNLQVSRLCVIHLLWSKLCTAGFRFRESNSAPEIFFAFFFSSLLGVTPWLERDRGEPTAALLPFNSHQISSRSACLCIIPSPSYSETCSINQIVSLEQYCLCSGVVCAQAHTLNNFEQGSSSKGTAYHLRKQQVSA